MVNSDPRTPPWWPAVTAFAAALSGLFSDRLELLTLELQRTGRTLVQIAVLVLAAAILGVTAWLALWVAAGFLLVSLGWGWPSAVLSVLLVNALLAFFLIARVVRLLGRLSLPATRRHLIFGAPAMSTRVDPGPVRNAALQPVKRGSA